MEDNDAAIKADEKEHAGYAPNSERGAGFHYSIFTDLDCASVSAKDKKIAGLERFISQNCSESETLIIPTSGAPVNEYEEDPTLWDAAGCIPVSVS